MLLIPYPWEISHFADSTNNCFAFALHDFAVGEEREVGILLMIIDFEAHVLLLLLIVEIVILGLLLDNPVAFLAVNGFIDNEIQLLNNDAISRHSVTLLNLNYVADNQVTYWNWHCCAKCTSENSYHLIVNLIFNFQMLSLFYVIAESSQATCKHETKVNCKWFYVPFVVAIFLSSKEWKDEVDSCNPSQVNHIWIFKLSKQNCPERWDFWKSNCVLSEYLLPSCNVWLVADDSSLEVCAK